MRLLQLGAHGELSLTRNFVEEEIPPYAILSHTWGADHDEVTFNDLKSGSGKSKAGYDKIRFCGEQAKKDNLQYFWVDTCCIDKANLTELSEAIISMFRWYRGSEKCYVYLVNVSVRNCDNNRTERTWKSAFRKSKWSLKRKSPVRNGDNNRTERTWESAFHESRWFTRGWTLQELIAPKSVEFFSQEGEWLGSKITLEQQIHEITEIPTAALRGAPLSDFSVEERLQWAKIRETKRKEDKAYCLLGIFDVSMSLRYGEGDKAFDRLKRKVHTASVPDGSEIPSIPSFTVPFRRDLDFIDRPDLLDRICTSCSLPGARTAIVGLGGVGKSQLAIEFCYRVRKQSPKTWIFWVHASNADRIQQGFREISEALKLPGRDDPRADILSLVHNWLQDERNGDWLLILDNVDDATFLVEKPVRPDDGPASNSSNTYDRRLLDYIPVSQNGSVLITSRTKGAALKLVEASDIIEVHPMEEESSVALIEKKLGPKGDREELSELARKLEQMPLAMVQAAAYISQRWPRCSVRQYIDKFEKNDKSRTSLLNHEAGQLRRDEDAKNSIIITWQISFDHIHNTRRSAAELLSLMSFFDRQGIPEAVLRSSNQNFSTQISCDAKRGREGEEGIRDDEMFNSESESSVSDQFEDDVVMLTQYSFISVSTEPDAFEMHGLVQLATRTWLEAHGQIEHWRQRYISHLFSAMPTGEYENWEMCRVLFPHAKAALIQQPEGKESQNEWGELLYRTAWYAWKMGNSYDAEVMAQTSMKIRKKMFGQEHPDTLSSMAMIGLACKLGGRWQEAEQLFVQVMETSSRVLGAEHPDTLTSMANLASTFWNQGRWQEAEQLFVQVMETRKRVLGAEHPDTLNSMANLASTFWNQGRWQEAEQLELQVMETRKRVLGAEHPDILTSMANLASTYRNQGRWQEAEQLFVQVMETSSRVLGAEHPDTLTSMANLASTYRNQGRWQEAEQLFVQVMETSSRVLGAEHPDTLTSMANLASTYRNQGRWQEAEQLFVQVMETSSRVLGAEHPSTLTIMANLASTYRNQGRWQEAEQLFVQVMETSSRVLGAEHPSTLTSMANLASTYRNQGRWQEAEQLELQVMETRKRVLGAEHPSTLTSMANLASTYRNQGRWQEAEQLFVQVMEMRKRVLGAEHPDTLNSLNNLAFTWKEQGKRVEALGLMAQCVRLRIQVLGAEHPYTRSSSTVLAEWKTQELDISSLASKSEEIQL